MSLAHHEQKSGRSHSRLCDLEPI